MCGSRVRSGADACPSCGARLHAGGRHLATQSGGATAGRRTGRRWLLAGVAALAVSGAVGAGFVFRDQLPLPWGAATSDKAAAPAAREVEVSDSKASGWVTGSDGERRYYDPTTHQLYGGWLDEGDTRLYLDEATGQPHVGWLELEGKRYWLDDGSTGTKGAPLKDQWLELDDERFYLSSDGSATTGWAEIDGVKHYFNDQSAKQTGWIDDGSGTTYWVKPEDGTLASHEWIEIDGIYQAFDDDGSWVTLGEVIPPHDEENLQSMSARQRRVLDSCNTTAWPGPGLCAGWVSSVFVNAGEYSVGGDACDIARAWCYSDDLSELKPGMVIAVTSHPRTDAGKTWGHVCIYVGRGLVMDSGSYKVRTAALGSWLAWFGATEVPRWGWANGVNLELG